MNCEAWGCFPVWRPRCALQSHAACLSGWVCNCLLSLLSPPYHASGFPLERKVIDEGKRVGGTWTPGLDCLRISYSSPQTSNNTLQGLTLLSRITVGWAVANF